MATFLHWQFADVRQLFVALLVIMHHQYAHQLHISCICAPSRSENSFTLRVVCMQQQQLIITSRPAISTTSKYQSMRVLADWIPIRLLLWACWAQKPCFGGCLSPCLSWPSLLSVMVPACNQLSSAQLSSACVFLVELMCVGVTSL